MLAVLTEAEIARSWAEALWAERQDDAACSAVLEDLMLQLVPTALKDRHIVRRICRWARHPDVLPELPPDTLALLVLWVLDIFRLPPNLGARRFGILVRQELLRRGAHAQVDRLNDPHILPAQIWSELREAVAREDADTLFNTLWLLWPFGPEVFDWCAAHRVLWITEAPSLRLLSPSILAGLPSTYLGRIGVLERRQAPTLDPDELWEFVAHAQRSRNSRGGLLTRMDLATVFAAVDDIWSTARALLDRLAAPEGPAWALYGLRLHIDGVTGFDDVATPDLRTSRRTRTVLDAGIGPKGTELRPIWVVEARRARGYQRPCVHHLARDDEGSIHHGTLELLGARTAPDFDTGATDRLFSWVWGLRWFRDASTRPGGLDLLARHLYTQPTQFPWETVPLWEAPGDFQQEEIPEPPELKAPRVIPAAKEQP